MSKPYTDKPALHNPNSADGKLHFVATFKPLPWQKAAMNDMAPTMLLGGAAGGGKSRVAAEKVHAFCLRYPGANCVISRKTREDAKNSVLQVYEKRVVGSDPRVNHRREDYRFEYENGSVVYYLGIKDGKAREGLRSIGESGGIDIWLMEEAIEFEEEDYNEVLLRMRGVAGAFVQIILVTNPGPRLHWINRRLIIGGEASVHYSRAADNPYLPEIYKVNLGRVTGVTRSRLVEGLWIDGEGLVVDTWLNRFNAKTGESHGGNVTLEADYIPGGGPVYLWADDGYAGEVDDNGFFTERSHPRVFLLVQIRRDGRFAVFAESFAIKTLTRNQIKDLKDMCSDYDWPWPPEAVDHDKAASNLAGELKEAGLSNLRTGPSSRDESIKLLKEVCAADENDVRRLVVHPRCRHTIMEFSSWSYDKNGVEIKGSDNSCFVAGTLVTTDRGDVAIELIRPGDMVLTRDGYRPVERAWMTSPSARVWAVELSDGSALEGTANHPIWVEGEGWVNLSLLREGQMLHSVSQRINTEEHQWQNLRQSYTRELSTGGTQTPNSYPIAYTSPQSIGVPRCCTGKSIRTSMVLSLMGIMYTTLTLIPLTTTHLIWWRSRRRSIRKFTQNVIGKIPSLWERSWTILRRLALPLLSGMVPRRVWPGIASMASAPGIIASYIPASVNNAGQSTARIPPIIHDFAQISVSQSGDVTRVSTTRPGSVRGAGIDLSVTNTTQTKPARVRVLRIYETTREVPVYNIEVYGKKEYYANGILVHNCDATRYGCWNYIRGPGRPVNMGVDPRLGIDQNKIVDKVNAAYEAAIARITGRMSA